MPVTNQTSICKETLLVKLNEDVDLIVPTNVYTKMVTILLTKSLI